MKISTNIRLSISNKNNIISCINNNFFNIKKEDSIQLILDKIFIVLFTLMGESDQKSEIIRFHKNDFNEFFDTKKEKIGVFE